MAINWDKVQYGGTAQSGSSSAINWDRVAYAPDVNKAREDARQRKETAQRQQIAVEKRLQKLDMTPEERKQEQVKKQWDNRYKLQRPIASTDPSIERFITILRAKQSDAPFMSKIEADIRSTPESELKDPWVQFASGVYEGTFGKTIDTMNKLGGKKQTAAGILAEVSAPYSDAWRTAGRLYGGTVQNLAMYGTVGKAAEGFGALQKIGSPFLRNLAGQQLADTLIQTPGVVIEGVADKKPVGEVLKDVGIQQGQDLAANLLFGGVEAGLSRLSRSRAAKQAAKTVDDIPPIGGKTTADSIDDQVKKLDDYFQQKRTAPIGGEPMSNAADTAKARIYGETPKGEIPEWMKERGFSRNIRTDTAMPDDIRQMFDDDPLFYKQVSNKETLDKAQTVFSKGEEAATAEFYRLINDKKYHAEAIPLSKLLAKQALENGNITKAREILSEAADKLTDAGRTAQAAKILREADPETFLMTIDKQLRKLNEQGLKQYGKKWKNIDLLPDEITAIQNIPRGNQQAYEEVWEQIGERIAKQLPSTGMEKYDAWRRMAMLLNPKTHIRNTVGNVIMSGMRKVSDTIGAALEKVFVPTGQRTKSFGWSFNKDIVSKVDETWDAVKKDILGESRWEIDNLRALGREKRIFKNPALQWLNEVSLKTLNAEDNVFAKRAFKDALGQYMQANRLTEATDAAIEYAKRRALEATFKQYNDLAATLNRWKQKPGYGKLVEAAVPFTKTPANIAMSAIEYSPVGLTRLLFSKGKTPAEIIETLSKGLTGSGLFALGMWLNSLGWARAGKKRSEKAEALLSEVGEQQYSIITPQGSYTIDWAQPFAIPFFMGVALSEAMREKDTIDYEAIMDGIARGGDTFFYMSMLQEVKRILGAGSTTGEIIGLPWSYVQQAWPAVFGQAARTIDPVRRSTYDPNRLKQTWNIIQSRTPYIGVDWLPSSKKLEPALNIWGEEQIQGGALQQFVSPGYFKAKSDDPVTLEVARLYGEFKDTDMLPKANVKSFTDKGIEYRLTAEQATEFQRKMGQENYSDIARLISSAEYQKMTDEQKAKKIEKIVDRNYEEAKKDIIKASAIGGK